MKILIAGASSPRSIGAGLGRAHEVVLVSRSGAAGVACNITREGAARGLLEEHRPDAVVHAAGVYHRPQRLGTLSSGSYRRIEEHLDAKCLGSLMLLDAAVAVGTVKHFVVLGGREVSSDAGFAFYTIANGALWSLVRFANKHTLVHSYFLDLPLVKGSAMGERLAADAATDATGAIEVCEVERVLENILRNQVKPGRIELGSDWTA